MSSYKRVLPRDLFNEASLLKCLGRVSLLIEDGMAPSGMRLEHTGQNGFEIDQSPGSGDLCCMNLMLITPDGRRSFLWRNHNSREEWPLFVGAMVDGEEEEIEVFDTVGNFTSEFVVWVSGKETS